MSIKAKKRLIVVLSIILLIIVTFAVGVNLYVDSFLNKLDRTKGYKGDDVNGAKLEGNVTNIALLGVDAEGGDGARTDVIKLISVDYDHKKIKITSIQRDNLVYQPMEERYEKLNHAYMRDGIQGTLSSLNYNFDLDITQYVKFEFDSVEKIVDILGGVDIALTDAEAASLGVGGAGTYHLNGSETLAYSRIRNLDSDYGRMSRQNNVINAVLASVKGQSVNELLNTASNVLPYIETNITNNEMKSMALGVVGFDLGNTEQYQFPSEGYSSILSSLYLYGYGPHYVLKDFAGEVKKLHNNIYEKDYKVSKNVEKVAKETKEMAGY